MFTTSHAPIVRTHPLTGLPLAPVGYRRNGCPIWPIMGGSEAAGEGGDAGADAGAAAGTDAGADTGKTDEAADKGDKPPADESVEAKAARLEAENVRLRRENAASRTTAKSKAAEQARQELLAELGGDKGDKPPTVEELKTQLSTQTSETEAARADARETKAELIVWRNADTLKVDPVAMTDSNGFRAAIKDLDPSDLTKFEEAVKKAAQEAVSKNPKLAAAPVAGSSSADHGGPVGGAAKKPQSLDAAVGGHYGT